MSLAGLKGNIVQFTLSAEGAAALTGIIDRGDFDAQVMDSDELGAWIYLSGESVMLLKWQYIATMVTTALPAPSFEPQRARIGF